MKIPANMISVIGQASKGTRTYVATGNAADFRAWQDAVTRAFGSNLILLSWVADYIGISRASVHKGKQRGKLTVISFRITELVTTLTGTRRAATKEIRSYAFIDECKDWINELSNSGRVKANKHHV